MSNDISKLESATNEDLEKLDNWLKGNKLSLNVERESLCLFVQNQGGKFSTAMMIN